MSAPRDLTSAEAAARLGLKKATLYAYVSRGLLHRYRAPDGRASRFDADEVEAFRAGRRRTAEGELDAVISTAITSVRDGELLVRGQDLPALVASGGGYEAVVALLWGAPVAEHFRVSPPVRRAVAAVQSRMPESARLVDRLRATVSVASALDPLRFDLSPEAVHAAGGALIAAFVEGLPPAGSRSPARKARSIAARLWPRLSARRSNAAQRATLDAALALLADHGLATSTFGARVAASVRADPYSVVLAGLGVVGGARHGAASAAVHALFTDALAREDPTSAVGEVLRRSGQAPGFGHAVYHTSDPRYRVLAARIESAWKGDARLETVRAVRDVVLARTASMPNIDLALGALTFLAGMPPDAGETLFAIARTAGWLTHALEEYAEPALRFRPRARYRGD